MRALLLLVVLAAPALGAEYDLAALEASKPKEISAPPKEGEPFFEAGRRIYFRRCAPCHGVRGGGDGRAAPYQDPRPRDFTTGQYKLRSTRTGELPTDADLFRSVSRGLPGTAMPAWGEGTARLTELERWQVVYFVKHLGRDFWNPEFDPYGKTSEGSPRRLELPPPPPSTPERIARGKAIFLDETKGGCVKCHGPGGRGDGAEAKGLKVDWGDPILPANLTKPWRYKNGARVSDVFVTFSSGFNGTPMPAFDKSIPSADDRWDLAMYVATLQEPVEEDHGPLRAQRVVAIPEQPEDAAWAEAPQKAVWLAGQLVVGPRWANPSVELVRIRALYDDREIAFLLQWDDRFKNDQGPAEAPGGALFEVADTYLPADAMRQRAATLALPDQLALAFPVGAPVAGRVERPYFFMGDPAHRINAWLWRADQEGAAELNAAGAVRGYSTQPPDGQGLRARARFDQGRWTLVLRRALTTQEPKLDAQLKPGDLVPFTLRAWDGAAGEWGLQSSISSWHFVRLEEPTPPRAYGAGVLAFGLIAALEAFWLARLRRKA